MNIKNKVWIGLFIALNVTAVHASNENESIFISAYTQSSLNWGIKKTSNCEYRMSSTMPSGPASLQTLRRYFFQNIQSARVVSTSSFGKRKEFIAKVNPYTVVLESSAGYQLFIVDMWFDPNPYNVNPLAVGNPINSDELYFKTAEDATRFSKAALAFAKSCLSK